MQLDKYLICLMFLEIIDVRVYAPLLLFTVSNLEAKKVK